MNHLSLRIKELADGILEFVEEHRIERRAELQPHQVLDVGADLQPHLLVVADHEGEQAVDEFADRGLHAALGGDHGDHGALALVEGAHGGAVGGQPRAAAVLQAHPAQGAQEPRHVDPLLQRLRVRQVDGAAAADVRHAPLDDRLVQALGHLRTEVVCGVRTQMPYNI